jgi:amino acid transporter
VSRNGSVMLTFFPAVGQRKYDYTKKQVAIISCAVYLLVTITILNIRPISIFANHMCLNFMIVEYLLCSSLPCHLPKLEA